MENESRKGEKNGVNGRTNRSTTYPCCVSALGGFSGSWLYAAHRGAKVKTFASLQKIYPWVFGIISVCSPK